MRILVLGGSRFVGRHIVDALRPGGHEVAVFNRGTAALPWDDVEQLRGDRETGDLRSLEGRDWDACIDVSCYLPEHALASAELLADRVERYVFISTVSVYAAGHAGPMDESAPVLPPPADGAEPAGAELYGARKVACEQAVERAFRHRALMIRPGIVAGAHDPTNRFAWWVERLARGGEVLAPGSPNAAVQLVDARDLGAFTAALTAQGTTGVFNVCGPPASFGELIEACRAATGSDAAVTWVGERLLLDNAAEPFSEIPLWVPDEPEFRAFYSMSNARARAAGLTLRPLADTARATWDWLRAVRAGDLAAPDAGGFVARGLSPEREAELLAIHHSP